MSFDALLFPLLLLFPVLQMNPNLQSGHRSFNVISWNVRGLGDSDKCNLVRNAFRDANPVIVCLQETKLCSIDFFKAATFLPKGFLFVFSPSDGARGGILTAWNPTAFALKQSFSKPYSLTCVFSCNLSNLDFTISNTYGPSDHSFSLGYLQHLQELPASFSGPWILLGDFNLVRQQSDKSNGQINTSLAAAFNNTLDFLCMSEIPLSDRCYTWSNHQTFPILAHLDWVFVNNELNTLFPMSNLSSLPKPTSDHVPLLLSLSTELPKPMFFRFEKHWLHHQSFLPSALAGWQAPVTSSDVAGRLAARIKSTRAAAKVWSRCNRTPTYLIHNHRFIVQLFDYFEEMCFLSNAEIQARAQAREEIQQHVKQQAAYWKQRSKHRAIKESDANTKFHHAQATQRLRCNFIRMVQVDGVQIVSHSGKTAALTAYFKSIIGVTGQSQPAYLEDLYADSYRPSENIIANFSEAETNKALLSMNMNSVPGPDGFGPLFYKAAWGTVKHDLMQMLSEFHSGQVDMQRINRSHMVLIPKKPDAVDVGAFRPIALQNCCYKILAKVLTTRLQAEIPNLIDINQTGFIKGRAISDTFVFAMELVQVCHKRRMPAIVLKLDFAKAFDTVNWDGLQRVLREGASQKNG